MRNAFSAIILFSLLPSPVLSLEPAEDTDIPPVQADAEDVRSVRDRLMTSLFFRGELADRMMETGIQGRFVALTGQETRSEVRLALIEWIRKNPDEAANLSLYLKSRPPGAGKPPEVITYKDAFWELNPYFLELVRGVKNAATDMSVSEEEMSLLAQRLFEGPQAPPEAYAPRLPVVSPGSGGASPPAAIRYADYTLNAAAVERERAAFGEWFERAGAVFEAEAGNAKKDAHFSRRRGIFNETFSLYGKFVVALSGLKGRGKITEEESLRLEELRRALRKNFGALETLSLMRGINDRAEKVPALSPGAQRLLDDARRIEAAVLSLLSELEKDSPDLGAAGRRLRELERSFELWNIRFSAHQRLLGLKNAIEGRVFSCVLDRLMFEYLSRFHRSSAYVRLASSVGAHSKPLDISIGGVASGDYEAAASFSGVEKKPLMEKILEVETEVARLAAYSRFNRRLQFIFWDVFFNPFGLEPAPKGLTAGSKLLF